MFKIPLADLINSNSFAFPFEMVPEPELEK
jgi:hypothetical protein